eukprot:TRINITY_DN12543_c0_g1_i1.p1 TRINITY_DN12543_c0_g1~~TRINITY_DN12543_c0_g1_i1.p1  ORF type:complete len:1093 (-),score=343.00 TRINITY_DN12543_c0_g1_i1:40-3318(-)
MQIAQQVKSERCTEKEAADAALVEAKREEADAHSDRNHKHGIRVDANQTREAKNRAENVAEVARAKAKAAQEAALEFKTHKCQIRDEAKADMEEKCNIAAEKLADMQEKLKLKNIANNKMLAAKAEWEARLAIWEETKRILKLRDEAHTQACAATDEATHEALEAFKIRNDLKARIPPTEERTKRATHKHVQCVKEREAAVDAADRAKAALKAREAAAIAAGEVIMAEDEERSTVFGLERKVIALEREELARAYQLEQDKIRLDGQDGGGSGEAGILREHESVSSTIQPRYDTVKTELTAAEHAQSVSVAQVEVATKLLGQAKHWEQVAVGWVDTSKQELGRAQKAQVAAAAASRACIETRRASWRSSFRAESAQQRIEQAKRRVETTSQKEKLRVQETVVDAEQLLVDAQRSVQEHTGKLDQAQELISEAGASGDLASLNSAREARVAAESARNAAAQVVQAAQKNLVKVQEEATKSLAAVAAMVESANSIVGAQTAVEQAAQIAAVTSTYLSEAKNCTDATNRLVDQAGQHVRDRLTDLATKSKDTVLQDRNLVERQDTYRRFAAAVKSAQDSLHFWDEIWRAMELRRTSVASRVEQLQATIAASAEVAESAKAATVAARTEAEAARVRVEAQKEARQLVVTKAGLQYIARMTTTRARWAEKMLQDANAVELAAIETNKPGAQAVADARKAREDQEARTQAVVDEQDALVGQTTADVDAKKRSWKEKMTAAATAQSRVWELHELESRLLAISRVTERREQVSEDVRRAAALSALFMHVRSAWIGSHKPPAPSRARVMQDSFYHRIEAMWHFDGAPVAQSHMDSWSLNSTDLFTAPPDRQPPSVLPLKLEVRESCSVACESVSEVQCEQGSAGADAACGRGQVLRVRFGRTRSVVAESDWFVCRCNTGVLQLAASNSLRTRRSPNEVEVEDLEVAGVVFDTPLHGAERIPDRHVYCFRDFGEWLHSKPAFSQPTDLAKAHLDPDAIDHGPAGHLDALALSSPGDLMSSYQMVKETWRKQCLSEAASPAHLAGTYPGSTDSSMEILHLPAGVAVDLETPENVAEVDMGRAWDRLENAGWVGPLSKYKQLARS